jgi:hypothetical protein
MRRLLALTLCAAAAGCSYTFDSGAPELPLVGPVPDTPSLPHLNDRPVLSEVFARGVDGRVWLIMQQTDNSYRMVPMSGDPTPEVLAPGAVDDLFVRWRALYLTVRPRPSDPSAPISLTVRSIGESPGHTFSLPGGPAVLFSGGADDVFVYLVTDGTQPGYLIQRRDESFKRIVPWPKGVMPSDPFRNGAYFFDSGAGELFFDRDADGRVVAHHTRDNLDVDLGIRPRFLAWLDAKTWVTCGNDGVRVVHLDGVTPERVLDADPCKQERLQLSRGYAYYDVGAELRKVKLDGSEPPQPVFDFGDNRVLLVATKTDTVLYSTDPSDRYLHAAGDGWLGGWRFMDRGTSLTMSSDLLHLWWLEHSAQRGGAGQLMTVTLPGPAMPGGTPTVLTRNTRQFQILPDHRILADENHAFDGTQDRVVVIDPLRGNKRWVASSSSAFASVPYTDDYIVDVVSVSSGHDVVRVTVPPPLPPPPPNE